MGFLHSRNVCQKKVITFIRLWEKCTQEEARLIIRERQDGSNWRSSSHNPKKIPQAMRNMKESTLEEPLIHISIWIRNDVVMNEEDDEAEGSRRILPIKQIKMSIQFSFHDIVCYAFVYIQLMCYSCLSICIYTTKLRMIGKKSMFLYYIPLLLI